MLTIRKEMKNIKLDEEMWDKTWSNIIEIYMNRTMKRSTSQKKKEFILSKHHFFFLIYMHSQSQPGQNVTYPKDKLAIMRIQPYRYGKKNMLW